MIVDIQTRRLRTIGQLRAFVEGNEAVDFQPRNRDEAYGQMSGLATREVLRRQHEVFREARSGAQATPSPFLNFHRPCLFATEYHDANGRVRRKYLAADVMTPYAKLRSLPGANQFLKPGVDFALLDAVAAAETDLEAARRVQAERRELFLGIGDGMAAARAVITPTILRLLGASRSPFCVAQRRRLRGTK